MYRTFPISTCHHTPPRSYIVKIKNHHRIFNGNTQISPSLFQHDFGSDNILCSKSLESSTEIGILQLRNPFLIFKPDPTRLHQGLNISSGAYDGTTNSTSTHLVNNINRNCMRFFWIHDWDIIDDEEVRYPTVLILLSLLLTSVYTL